MKYGTLHSYHTLNNDIKDYNHISLYQSSIYAASPHVDATFHLTVPEGETTTITESVLHFTDNLSNNREIVYTITTLVPGTAEQVS